MKKMKFLATAAIALMVGFTSCNKDNNNTNGVEEGKESLIELSLHFPKSSATKAADAEAKAGEADVKNVNLFIYSNNGTLFKVVELNSDSFENATDETTHDYYEMKASAKIAVTTGAKKFFVGVNLPETVINKIKAVNGMRLDKDAITFTQAELTTLANGLPMFSEVKDHTVVLSEDGSENKLTFDVERIVSKVTAEFNSTTLVVAGGDKVYEISFAINNFNTKSFVAATADFKDPNWAIGSYVASDFVNTAAANYASALDIDGITATPDDYTPAYANENTSEGKTKQEITRVTVRAKYVPAVQHKYVGGNLTIAEGADIVTAPQTFKAIQKAVGDNWLFFMNATEAADYITDENPATVLEYVDGHCYWNIYLNKTSGANQWDIIRNSHYQIKIKNILGIGSPDEDIVGPGVVTPDEESNLLFDVNIKNWKPVIVQTEDLIQQ